MAGSNGYGWIGFLARKYLYGRERENKNITQILSALGLAAGVLTLITVISIMNGLQLGYISDILEIGSYHIRVDGNNIGREEEAAILKVKGVESCVRFTDIQALAEGDLARMAPLDIRCIDETAAVCDAGFTEHLNIVKGDLDLEADRTVLLGYELARYLKLGIGDIFKVMTLSGGSFGTLKPDIVEFRITGIFKSGYYEYDRNMAVMSLKSVPFLQAGETDILLGIKLSDKYGDKAVLKNMLKVTDRKTISWREYNRAFFGALRMEKFAMMFLISLIFVVIGVNIFNFMKRSVSEKMEDIAVLYALGAPEKNVRYIFIAEGILVGFAGGLAGVAAGLLVSVNINSIFALAGKIVSYPADILISLFGNFFDFHEIEFALFSPSYFYIEEIPVEILFSEVLSAFLFAFLSAVISAHLAVKKLDVKNPASILRYE